MDARLILDAPARGSWNMAVDETLFQSVSHSPATVLRLYQWSEPTLSLGYFQRAADRESHVASRQATLVRRSTGGGAILHHHELTYSLTTHLANERPASARALLLTIHESLIQVLAELGIPVRRAFDSVIAARGEEPFFCFQRHTNGDLLVGSHKIVGSAQRRHRQGLLQHGSILLRRSFAAPELPGIEELAGKVCSAEALSGLWPRRLANVLGTTWTPSRLSSRERTVAEQMERERFSAASWNWKR